ncbi:hypothetical protein PCL_01439 [Purpureocillium lilacinum]|uniref:Uncharacterized protein n=1 Tax=Purpureocillium lilacinum TaxID=33203 RepID=A0A2U3E3K9_PURLI|nr:hypothetical protein PCL_01439 [Purpureocillium lilacinum]
MGYGKNAAKADALQGSHVSAVTGLSVACRDASHVFFVVQSGQQVLGITKDIKETIRQHLTSLTIVLLTTMAPKLVLTVRTELAKLNAGVSLLEAPMSGSPAKAEKGELTLMVSRIYYTGQLGNASSVKAIHQIVGATNLVASLEYMYIGSKYGLGPKLLYSILASSGSWNQYLGSRLKRLLESDKRPDAHETFIANDRNEISSRVAKSAVGDDGLLQGLRRLFASVAAKNVTEEADRHEDDQAVG